MGMRADFLFVLECILTGRNRYDLQKGASELTLTGTDIIRKEVL